MPMIFLALLALATFLIRFLPRVFRRNAIVSDTYYHLYYAELIRARGFRLPPTLPSVILKNEYTYPFGYHFLLALFPQGARAWVERGTAAFFDTVNLLIVYAASLWFLGRAGFPQAPCVALVVAFLYAFSPALLRVGSGPRAYNGSARVPGQMLFLAHILSAHLAWSTGSLAWAGLSALAGAVLLFTATFSTQVFILFGLGFSVFITPWHGLLMLASLALSALLTRGKTLHVLRGRIAHSTFYFRHMQRVFLYPHIVTVRRYLASVRLALRGLVRGEFRAFADWYFHTNHYLHLLVTVFPQLILLWCFAPWRHLGHPDARFLVVWVGNALFWAVLTKQKSLLFLGEGERYLEAAMLPSLLLLAVGTWRSGPWLLALLGLYTALSAVYLVRDYLASYRPLHEDYDRSEVVFQQMRQLPPGGVLPLGNVYWQAIQRAPHPVLTAAMLDARLVSPEEFFLACGHYPYPGPELLRIVERYGIEYVLAERAGLEHYLTTILPDPAVFHATFLLIRETENLLLFVRKQTFEGLGARVQEAIANLDFTAAKEGLDAMLLYFPDSEELAEARRSVERRMAEGGEEHLAAPGGEGREAFLHVPEWTSPAWQEVVLGYLEAFQPGDPVALLLPFDPAHPGAITLEDAQQAVLQLVVQTGREQFPDVVVIDRPEELLEILQDYGRVHWIPARPGLALWGALGERFNRARTAISARRRP